jgi:hypothetical protein
MTITLWITVVHVGSESFTILHPKHQDVLTYATLNLCGNDTYEALYNNQHSRVSWSFEDREGAKHECFTEHKEVKVEVILRS